MQENGKVKVAAVGCASYEAGAVKAAVLRALDAIGGIGAFIGRGERVLLKPNLLSAKEPDRAVTTHPAVVRAVAEMCLDRGAIVSIGDSPAFGNTRSAVKKSGLAQVAEELGLRLAPFDDPVEIVVPAGRTYRRIEVARDVVETDKIVNLPKLKTHAGMYLTLGVKNMFGSVIGTRKGEWHLKAGAGPDKFARVLLDLYAAVKPALTIVDAVIGMEGNGPANGVPRKLGRIFAAADAVALDATICRFVGAEARHLRTSALGEPLGAGVSDPARIDVVGDAGGMEPIADFLLPPLARNDSLLFSILQSAGFRRTMTVRPHVLDETCNRCGLCIQSCPAKAMDWGRPAKSETRHDRSVAIDLGKCIRCFCCQEICPRGGLVVREGWMLRMRNRLLPENPFLK